MTDWTQGVYTSDLQKTAAVIPETLEILRYWEPGIDTTELSRRVVEAGSLGRVSSVRVNDIVRRSFAQRFLSPSDRPAHLAKLALAAGDGLEELREILLVTMIRTYLVIYDFLVERYWPTLYLGRSSITGSEIVSFLKDKSGTERNPSGWSLSVTQRVARNLGKTLADLGLFENRRSPIRRFRHFEASDFIVTFILLDAHEQGAGDTALLRLPEWRALGLGPDSIVDRCRRVAGVNAPFVFQYSGELAQFSFKYRTVEEYLHGRHAA